MQFTFCYRPSILVSQDMGTIISNLLLQPICFQLLIYHSVAYQTSNLHTHFTIKMRLLKNLIMSKFVEGKSKAATETSLSPRTISHPVKRNCLSVMQCSSIALHLNRLFYSWESHLEDYLKRYARLYA